MSQLKSHLNVGSHKPKQHEKHNENITSKTSVSENMTKTESAGGMNTYFVAFE